VELAVRGHLDALVQPAGITALQYTALTVLRERDGQVAAELARASFVTPQTMADMVRGLERRGLITRARDPRDRKRLMISLTPAGLALLDDYDEQVARLEERMLAERQQLRRSLNRARLALEATPLE
jgi:DNA-binding MarR family transcriptional regulator